MLGEFAFIGLYMVTVSVFELPTCYTDVALCFSIVSCGDIDLVNHDCGKAFTFNRAVVALSAIPLLRFVSCCVARAVYIVCACLCDVLVEYFLVMFSDVRFHVL